MAYVGKEAYVAAWVAGSLRPEALNECCIHLLESREAEDESAAEVTAGEPSRGFIIQDWFGPFLLGPASRFLRGRC